MCEYYLLPPYSKAKGALWKPAFDPKDERAKKVRYAYPNSVRDKAEQAERDVDALSNTLKNIERIVKRYRAKSITEVKREIKKKTGTNS
jgi:tryptophan 2,3-dioxygenase